MAPGRPSAQAAPPPRLPSPAPRRAPVPAAQLPPGGAGEPCAPSGRTQGEACLAGDLRKVQHRSLCNAGKEFLIQCISCIRNVCDLSADSAGSLV